MSNLADLTELMREQNDLVMEDAIQQLEMGEKLDLIHDVMQEQALAVFDLVDYLKGNSLADLEDRKELLKLLKGLKPDDKPGSQESQDPGDGFGILGLAGLITGAVAGYVSGVLGIIKGALIDPITNLFKRAGKLIDEKFGITKMLRRFRRRLIVRIGRIGQSVNNFIDILRTNIVGIVEKVRDSFKVFSGGGGALGRVGKFIGEAVDALRSLGGMIMKTITAPFKAIKGVLGAPMGALSGFFDMMKPFLSVFRTIGKTLGRLFAPLGVLISIFDGGREAAEAFTKSEGNMFQKVLAGFTGFIGGIVDGAIMQLGDLLKDGLAWVAGALGFTEIEEALDSFSFSESFNEILDSIYGFIDAPIETIKGIIEDVKKGFEGAVSLGSDLNNFFKEVLRVILPVPDPNGKWYDPSNLVSKAIPDAVYEYAGINPETGAFIDQAAGQAAQLSGDIQDAAAAANPVVIPDGSGGGGGSSAPAAVPIEAQPGRRSDVYDRVGYGADVAFGA